VGGGWVPADARRPVAGATLICITHDITDTLDFDRVLVIEQGRIVEQGPPRALYEKPASRYRELCDEEKSVQRNLWAHPIWRRLRLHGGVIDETEKASEAAWTRA
jgi:ATP-binding cassette subfamily B protein